MSTNIGGLILTMRYGDTIDAGPVQVEFLRPIGDSAGQFRVRVLADKSIAIKRIKREISDCRTRTAPAQGTSVWPRIGLVDPQLRGGTDTALS